MKYERKRPCLGFILRHMSVQMSAGINAYVYLFTHMLLLLPCCKLNLSNKNHAREILMDGH